jgi:hypothetical protein
VLLYSKFPAEIRADGRDLAADSDFKNGQKVTDGTIARLRLRFSEAPDANPEDFFVPGHGRSATGTTSHCSEKLIEALADSTIHTLRRYISPRKMEVGKFDAPVT